MLSERVETELRGTAFYPMLNKVDMYEKYKIDLVLEGAELQKAQEMGLVIRQPKEGGAHTGPFVTFRVDREDTRKDIAEDKRRPILEKVPATNDAGALITDLIGNGSTVTVKFAAGPYVFKGKFGIYSTLLSVIVHTLVPYKKAA